MSQTSVRTSRPLPADRPVRALLVGAGAMGTAWAQTLEDTDAVDLVGWVDLDVDRLRAGAATLARNDLALGSSLSAVATSTTPDLVIDVTSPGAHRAVTEEALSLGLPVLGEKPMSTSMSDARTMVAAADQAGQLFVVSQTRRHNRQLRRVHAALDLLGGAGIVDFGMYRAPRFGGFRDEMPHPLLLDMSIHAADTARLLLPSPPVSVFCDAFNPSWSWYAGAAAATAVVEMADGSRFIYRGAWCADGHETSWNGDWRIVGEHGTVLWDGESAPVLQLRDEDPKPLLEDDGPLRRESVEGVIDEVVTALRTGTDPPNECHDNLVTLAIVHAAVRSADERRRVEIAELLDESWCRA